MEKREGKLVEEARGIVRKIEGEVNLASRWVFEMFLSGSDEQVFIQGFLRVLAEIPLPRWLSKVEEQREVEMERQMKNQNKPSNYDKSENLVLKEYIRIKNIQEENKLKLQPYYGRIKGVETHQKNSTIPLIQPNSPSGTSASSTTCSSRTSSSPNPSTSKSSTPSTSSSTSLPPPTSTQGSP